MANKDLQTILNNGEITTIFLGGVTSNDKVLKKEEIDTALANIDFTDLSDTPTTMTSKAKQRLVVSDDATLLEFQDTAYCGYSVAPALVLTNVYQKVVGFAPTVAPRNITLVDGIITVGVTGIYTINLERIYTNEDTAPNQPVKLFLDIRRNSISEFTREAIIGAATANDEPSISAFTSPLILDVVAGDTFEMHSKAEEGLGSPSSTQLVKVNFTIDRTH